MKNRWAFYLMSIVSLGTLAGIFAARGQNGWAIGFGLIALAYLVRGIYLQRRENLAHRGAVVESMAERKTSAEKRVIVQNLLDTRQQLKRRRVSELTLGLVVLAGIALVYPTNPLLAWSFSVLFLPLIYLIVRQTRSIQLIERGLAERGLLRRDQG